MNDRQVLEAVERQRERALAVHRFVHEHAELAHEEHECSRHLAQVLADGGLELETGPAGMATAFKATLRGRVPGPSVGVVAVYDAVPVFRADGTIEPVHSCGHDAISAGVAAAALALAELRAELAGSLVVFGCPADEIPAPRTVERGGGKALLADNGLWDGIDAALFALGREFVDEPAPLPFGTDFGNVSQRVPAALIGIGRPGGWSFHTDDGAAQFAADGHEAALAIAQIVALTTIRLFRSS